jgi:hypothetical protein
MSLEQDIEKSISWLKQLREDLKTGKAKEVPLMSYELHVVRHFLREETAAPVLQEDGREIPMIKKEQCVDILKPWAIVFFIATCPRTGIRFVETEKR